MTGGVKSYQMEISGVKERRAASARASQSPTNGYITINWHYRRHWLLLCHAQSVATTNRVMEHLVG